jgi:hypothetical protein
MQGIMSGSSIARMFRRDVHAPTAQTVPCPYHNGLGICGSECLSLEKLMVRAREIERGVAGSFIERTENGYQAAMKQLWPNAEKGDSPESKIRGEVFIMLSSMNAGL